MTNASKAPSLREWPKGANSVFVVDDWFFSSAASKVSCWITRTEREEYEQKCAEDAAYLARLADEQEYRLPADADALRVIAARIRENAG